MYSVHSSTLRHRQSIIRRPRSPLSPGNVGMQLIRSAPFLFLASAVLCLWSACTIVPHWSSTVQRNSAGEITFSTLSVDGQTEKQPQGSSRSVIRVGSYWQTEKLNSKLLREHGPCEDHIPTGGEAMIIRVCCELTEIKKANIRQWSKQLRGMDFWILYDYGTASEDDIAKLEKDFRELQVDHAFSVFLYNTDVAERLYPAARQTLETMRGKVNWAIHEVSLAAWWRMCAKHQWGDEDSSSQKLQPPAVWSIEADAAFSGNVMTFFDYYKDKPEHFIAGWVDKSKEAWIQEKYNKLPGMSKIPHNVMVSKPDAVMRLSSRLMYHIDAALRLDLVLYGEMYASTICKGINPDWCTIKQLVDGPFYSPEQDGFNSVHFLNATEWERANTELSLQNRWYHPIAALKEHKRI